MNSRENGRSASNDLRAMGRWGLWSAYISSATFYKWRAKFGGMDASLMARLRELEDENRRLKKMYAEERLKAEIIQEAMAKKW